MRHVDAQAEMLSVWSRTSKPKSAAIIIVVDACTCDEPIWHTVVWDSRHRV